MHKRLLALFLLVLAWSGSAWGERVQDLPPPTNYVNDFAGVLSPGTLSSLNALCAQVDRQAHAQIAVVTVKTLDGEPIENFATALEDKWKVGKKGTDRGLLLILATDDRKYRVEVGYGLEGILPDGRVGDIGRAMVPYLRQNDYDGAVTMAVRQIAGVIAADAGVTLNTGLRPRYAPAQQANGGSGGMFDSLIGGFLKGAPGRGGGFCWRFLDCRSRPGSRRRHPGWGGRRLRQSHRRRRGGCRP